MTIDDQLRRIIRTEVQEAIRTELRPVLQALERLAGNPDPQNSVRSIGVAHTAEPGRWLAPSEVAVRLRISVKTLANWRASGRGPAYRKVGRLVRYEAQGIESFAQEGGASP